MDVDIATFGTLDGKHDADNWFVNKDSFIPQEAFQLSSYEFLVRIPDMSVGEVKEAPRVKKQC